MTLPRRPLLLALALAACASRGTTAPPATPAADGSPIVIGERLGLRSEILGEERAVLVHRPTGPDRAHPVLYLLDGDAHFHHTSGLVQFLVMQRLMPPMVVVGVSNVDRSRDFTPTRVAEVRNSGGADAFLEFIEKELVPAVESRFGAAPYRVLVGHSYGGLLAIHALTRKPDLFDATISISPSLAWGDRLMLKQSEELFAARPALERALYVTVGNEPPAMMASNRAYAELLRSRAPRGLRWSYEEMENEDHGTLVHRAIYRGLEHVFQGWRAPATVETLTDLEAHYQTLAARFRLPLHAPEAEINLLGYRLLGQGRLDEALAAFRRNVELYPSSANVHDSLGEALESKGDLDEAIRSYDLAVKTAATNRDPLLETFKANLDRARARTKK